MFNCSTVIFCYILLLYWQEYKSFVYSALMFVNIITHRLY